MHATRRILLIDADIDHRAELKQALDGLPYEVVGEAGYGVEATRRAAELQPELALGHGEEPLALALRTLDNVQQLAPRATTVVVSRRNDPDIARKAMLAGARGFVVSPATPADLDQVLAAACERQERLLNAPAPLASESGPEFDPDAARTGGYIVTVFGPKGGVGKTTISTNLALALRKHTEARVVLVDVDAYFGDVSVMMGVEPDRTLLDLLREYQINREVEVAPYLTDHPSGVALLAARHTVEMGRMPDPDAIAELLQVLAGWFDFVVVDTPGHFGPQVAAALDESTTVLLVTSADISSIKDARISIETLRHAGFDSDRLKVVVNHATGQDAISREDIARTIDYEVFWELPHDRAVGASIQQGTPVVLSEPRAKIARQVDGMASYFSEAVTGKDASRCAEESRGRRFPWRSSN